MPEIPANPFKVGDFALRFLIAYRGDLFTPRKVVEGVQCVWIVAITSDRVTWTNGQLDRSGNEYRHTCDPRELIPLSYLETLSGKCAVNRNGCAQNQARAAA